MAMQAGLITQLPNVYLQGSKRSWRQFQRMLVELIVKIVGHIQNRLSVVGDQLVERNC